MVVYELWRENVWCETEISGAVFFKWGQSNWFPVMNRASRKACVCGRGWRDASLSCASSLGADPEPGWGRGPLRLPHPQTNPACATPQTSASWGCFPNKWKNNVLEPRVKLNYLRKTLWTNTEGRGKPSDQSSSPGARQDEGGSWAGGRRAGPCPPPDAKWWASCCPSWAWPAASLPRRWTCGAPRTYTTTRSPLCSSMKGSGAVACSRAQASPSAGPTSPSWACQVGVGTDEAGSRLLLSPQPGGTLELGSGQDSHSTGSHQRCKRRSWPHVKEGYVDLGENIQDFILKGIASEEASHENKGAMVRAGSWC